MNYLMDVKGVGKPLYSVDVLYQHGICAHCSFLGLVCH